MSQKEPSAEKSLESVLKDISKGRRAPCYLLYGDEDFLVEEALGKLVDALIRAQDRDLNLFVMDNESGGVDPVCEALLTPPLIPGPKVVLLPKTRLFYSKTSLPELVEKNRRQRRVGPPGGSPGLHDLSGSGGLVPR